MPKDNQNDSYNMDEVLSPCFYSVDFYQKRKKGKFRLVEAPTYVSALADTHCHIEMYERPFWAFIRCALHGVQFVCCVIDSVDDGPAGIDLVRQAYSKASAELPGIIEQIAPVVQVAGGVNGTCNTVVCKPDNTTANTGARKSENDPITIKLGDDPELIQDAGSICPDPVMPQLKFIVGCHPHYAKDFDKSQEQNLVKMIQDPQVCAVGEIGLDYHYDLSPRDAQVEAFKKQLKIADEAGLPVALHLREAHDVALQVFDEVGFSSHGTLLHCFNLGPEELKPWVDAGCYIALGGPVTFKKSDETRQAASMIPADKLLTETDGPFMTPEPVRGDVCFPDHVVFTAKCLADALGVQDQAGFYQQLFKNAKTLLDRPRC